MNTTKKETCREEQLKKLPIKVAKSKYIGIPVCPDVVRF